MTKEQAIKWLERLDNEFEDLMIKIDIIEGEIDDVLAQRKDVFDEYPELQDEEE